MIFAAGRGTRLHPLTHHRPKALVEVAGKPMLEIVIRHLIRYGFNDIIINIHHFGEQIVEFVQKNSFDARIVFSDETDCLLDTGGGLKKAAWFFNDGQPFLVHNVDVFSGVNLPALYEYHIKNDALVTLSVRKKTASRELLVNGENRLCGWRNNRTGEVKHQWGDLDTLFPCAYDGIQVVSPRLFEKITEEGVFSVIDVYLRLCPREKILVCPHDHWWVDAGKKETLAEAARVLKEYAAGYF